VKADFGEWLESKNYDASYQGRILSELDKRVGVLGNQMDVIKLFKGLSHGQQHNLNRAVRALFNFYEEAYGVPENYLNALRKAIPQEVIGADLKVPTAHEILKSLTEVVDAPVKYQALYNLLFDSGLRETEACKLINHFEGAQEIRGILRCLLGYFRGTKLAYFAYFTMDTLQLIQNVKEPVKPRSASAYFYKRGFVAGKYLRKFTFDTMISLNIPESVADFIEGRVPIKIGAKHYLALMRRADQFYPRYAKYVAKLRQKALN